MKKKMHFYFLLQFFIVAVPEINHELLTESIMYNI